MFCHGQIESQQFLQEIGITLYVSDHQVEGDKQSKDMHCKG